MLERRKGEEAKIVNDEFTLLPRAPRLETLIRITYSAESLVRRLGCPVYDGFNKHFLMVLLVDSRGSRNLIYHID